MGPARKVGRVRPIRRTDVAVPRSEAVPPPRPGGRTVEIALDPAPVVNQTSRFVFVDQTDRPEPRVRSMPERQAAVEAVRQSLRLPEGR